MNVKLAMKAGVAALVVMMATGCSSVSQKDFEALSAKVDQVAKDAASAKSAADAASASSAEAGQKASGAQSTANQALNAANQSQACCDATNEKMDRMFKRSQAK
jgi:methyl-accepting chemotaxis protein